MQLEIEHRFIFFADDPEVDVCRAAVMGRPSFFGMAADPYFSFLQTSGSFTRAEP